MMTLSNNYPAGMRVSAQVASALMQAGRIEEAVNVHVYLLDPLNPDGSAPLAPDGEPSQSKVRGEQVDHKLGLGFRDPDLVKTVRFDLERFDALVEATDAITNGDETVALVDVPDPKPRRKKTDAK